ncbi:MAG: tetratricopeptide repeat protein [Candidatus Omnitrophica bacterium]|nr:tetratricopeptide repeat protein [Candidatus Omnitrophota bacterium]
MRNKILLILLSVWLGCSVHFCLAADDANMIGNKGIKLIQEGKMDEGLDLIRQAIQADPQKPDWHMNYGSLLFKKGQQIFQSGNMQEAQGVFKEAEKELLLATQLFKEADNKLKSHCYFLLGDIYYYVYSEKEKARNFYQKSLELYSEHQEAREALKSIVDDNMAQGAKGLSIEKGVEFGKRGMYEEAIVEFTRIINAEPNNANAYVNRGLAYRMKGEIDQAISDYDKAIEISPDSSNLYNVRAIAYFSKQNYSRSWDDVHKCQGLGGYIDPKFLEELKRYSGRKD